MDRLERPRADFRSSSFSDAEIETLSRGLEIVASRKLSDPEDVREAVQETLTRTLEAIHDGRIPSDVAPSAFAHGVHRHVVADILRRRYRDRARPVPAEILPATDPSPLERLVSSEQRRRVARAVARLPVRDQELLRSCFMEGRKLVEIARELGVSSARLRKRKSRALERLRELLGVGSGAAERHDPEVSPTEGT